MLQLPLAKTCIVIQESSWGWLANWDWITIFTLVLAVVTLWLALETRRLRKDAAKSVKAAEVSAAAATKSLILSTRPKIVVRNVTTDNDDLINGPHEISGMIQIFNAGNSVANIFLITCVVWIGKDLPMHFPYDTRGGDRQEKPKFSLEPGIYQGSSFSLESKYNFGATDARGAIDPARFIGLNNGSFDIFVMGEIAYADELKVQRISRFCRRYDRIKKRFFAVQDPDYETAN